jgi:hypothetical protein
MRLTLDGLVSALRAKAGQMADDVDSRYGRGQAVETPSASRFTDTGRMAHDDVGGG